ncbi:MAG: hypothetical protein WAN99_06240 [Methanoculleus sp.]
MDRTESAGRGRGSVSSVTALGNDVDTGRPGRAIAEATVPAA